LVAVAPLGKAAANAADRAPFEFLFPPERGGEGFGVVIGGHRPASFRSAEQGRADRHGQDGKGGDQIFQGSGHRSRSASFAGLFPATGTLRSAKGCSQR
jgi:hypothetical protein